MKKLIVAALLCAFFLNTSFSNVVELGKAQQVSIAGTPVEGQIAAYPAYVAAGVYFVAIGAAGLYGYARGTLEAAERADNGSYAYNLTLEKYDANDFSEFDYAR